MSHLTASDELVNFTHLYHQHVGILCHHTSSTRNDCLELGGKKNESVGLSLESDSLWVCSQWTVAHQAPLFMEFPGQEYWSGLPFPSPGIVPTQGSNPALLHCRQILYCLSHQGSLKNSEAWKEKVGWSWIRTAGYQYIRVQKKKKKSPNNFKIPHIMRQRKLYSADLFRNIIYVHMLLEGIFS